MINDILEEALNINAEHIELPEQGGNPDNARLIFGAQAKIDEKRHIEMISLSDGSFQASFFNECNKTSIRLSEEAINVFFGLWLRLKDSNNITTDLPLNI